MSNILTDVLTGGVGSIVDTVGKLASDLITTDAERLAAENEAKQIDADVEKSYLGDKDSARRMQMSALTQEDVFSKRFVYYFSAGWSVFAMVFMCIVTMVDIPKENVSNVNIILGFLLGTAVASIFSFFLGTTQTSKNKDSTIAVLSSK